MTVSSRFVNKERNEAQALPRGPNIIVEPQPEIAIEQEQAPQEMITHVIRAQGLAVLTPLVKAAQKAVIPLLRAKGRQRA
jgi:hypothetical protein